MAAYQQLRRREDRMAQWLKQITQPTLFRCQQVTAGLSLLCPQSRETLEAADDDEEETSGSCIEPQLLKPSTTEGVILRCSSLLVQSPTILFGNSKASPLRVVGSRLGPWTPTSELSPTKASAVSTSDDGLIPLRWKIYPCKTPDWCFTSYRFVSYSNVFFLLGQK